MQSPDSEANSHHTESAYWGFYFLYCRWLTGRYSQPRSVRATPGSTEAIACPFRDVTRILMGSRNSELSTSKTETNQPRAAGWR